MLDSPTLEENSLQSPPLMLPTRIVTYAWGQEYIDSLLAVTLPALLAPGNLPAVAAATSCEVVILTEEAAFPRFLADPTMACIEKICPVRLLELDDLIPAPDKYGMALTYVLHRSFSDLGEEAANSWMMFLNADFVLADGSLQNLLRCLSDGARLVASPSYCVNEEAVRPQLLRRVDPVSRQLALSKRDMAELVLRNRHNTIRAKTINFSPATIKYMDQFYWMVDDHTLLGHQMPVAIVGMRPERHLVEPNAYWDHGLMREFCPSAEHCVMGDSDEFLMLELRGQRVAQDQLKLGAPDPAEVARNTMSFITDYQRDMAHYPLTLHSRDLPATIEEGRQQLRNFVDATLAHLPPVLPSHIDHPQWDYHRPGFIEARHNYLSKRYGVLAEAQEPPYLLNDADRIWWKLNQLKLDYEQETQKLSNLLAKYRGRIKKALARLDRTISQQLSVLVDQDLKQLEGAPAPSKVLGVDSQDVTAASADLPPVSSVALTPLAGTRLEYARLSQEVDQKRVSLKQSLMNIERFFTSEFTRAKIVYDVSRSSWQLEYERWLYRKVVSAAIPDVIVRQGPQRQKAVATKGWLLRVVRRVGRRLFGSLPRVTRLNPYWAPLSHLVRVVDKAAKQGAADVLQVVGGDGRIAAVADRFTGTHAYVPLPQLLQGNLSKRLDNTVSFDVCVCELALSELERFENIVEAVTPKLRETGVIIAFCSAFDGQEIGVEGLGELSILMDRPTTTHVYTAGSPISARVLHAFRGTLRSLDETSWLSVLQVGTKLLFLVPRALVANFTSGKHSSPVTSITIERLMGEREAFDHAANH